MSEVWDYQIRATLSDRAAELTREEREAPELAPLFSTAARHKAVIVSQYDAFAHYVAEAEKNGEQDFPLYKWTRATIEDPVKAAKHRKIVTFYLDGEEVYPRSAAEALEADLQLLLRGGLIEKIAKYDTNPANNPQPPAHLQG
jgi:hypothetical protein